ncbi:glycoside hydrolase family 43 protein [Robiginitalea sp. SC105]|uniref:glycoside hydrolase family 43 protein n=1 Tax=Robiginitalea sp. SC105 TaxID=2762332 RepID=UPI00163B27C2|nr:glycoside hydrolase family 43 protein [Robiginitalea sp. SC105]MBC2838749.1 glycoside hydrolase family 43 protein [Robiginitalea sp. SC105]
MKFPINPPAWPVNPPAWPVFKVFLIALLLPAVSCRDKKPAGPEGLSSNREAVIQTDTTIYELTRELFTADPSAHVFEGKVYVYPSHDYDSGVPADDLGSHFDMKDYHVYSMDSIGGPVTDHGVALDIGDVPWAGRQLWAPDAAQKGDSFYFYFPAKDKEDIFRIGVASSASPSGPFVARETPVPGSYSIDPAIFQDGNAYFMYFGGIWGGQLQKWPGGTYQEDDVYPADDQPAIAPRVARLSEDMANFAEPPREVLILDENGKPILAGDHERRFFEAAWVHRFEGTYYLSYSTGDTHNIAYATGDNPYGPFTYRGVILEPVLGWTNHHSIVEYKGQWWLFFHDSSTSGGQTHLRNVKFTRLQHNPDGTIRTRNAMVEP